MNSKLPEPPMDSKIDEMLDGFFIMRSASPDDDLELLKARNQSGEPKHELKAQIKQLIADECSLERKRHVLIEGGLRQELNEIKNAIRVLAALQGEE